MRVLLVGLLITCSACTVAAPAASSRQTADPTGSERLSAQVPEDWLKVINKQIGSLHIEEFLPPDSPTPWIQKLSYEALAGAGLPDPLEFVDGLAQEQEKLCNGFDSSHIFAGFENGYAAVVSMLQCWQNQRTGKPILTMIKVIRGNKALYTITRIWRLENPPPQLRKEQKKFPVDEAQVAGWSQVLRKISLCDSALDAHRCE